MFTEESVLIPLTRGQFAIVDVDLRGVLDRQRWHAMRASKSGGFYAACNIGSKKSYMHWYVIGQPLLGLLVDHINGNTLDNRRVNLRLATRSQNQHNKRGFIGRLSRFKGVIFDRRAAKWTASISFAGRTRYLGGFDDERDAALAYDVAAKEMFGDFARVNITDLISI